MGDRLRATIPSRYITSQLGQLSLASLRGRLIEYQLRLGGEGRDCHLCRVADNTVLSHAIWRVSSVAVRRLANCCTPFTSTAPSYLAETLHLSADVGSRRRLWSTSTSTLVIPTTRRTTLGDRAFPGTAARAWNALPSSVRSAPSLLQFRRDLRTALFQSSYSSP